MSDYSDLESRLEALAPRPLSQDARDALYRTVDDLAAEAGEVDAVVVPFFTRYRNQVVSSAAVAAIAVAASLLLGGPSTDEPVLAQELAGFVPLEEAVSTEEIAENAVGPEGFITEAGWPVRKVRYRVIKEATVQDEASGVVMTIIDPTDEVVEGAQKSF